MPRASSTPSHRVPFPATGFTVEQWRLVSKLPAEVMIATVATRDDLPDAPAPRRGCPETAPAPRRGDPELATGWPPAAAGRAPAQRRTVAEGLAGLDAIAAGRSSDSDLVRAVVAAIYAEPEDDRPQQPAARPDPGAPRDQVLADCRKVAEVLRASADPADAAVYLHWVRQVAVRVCVASGSASAPGRRRFLDDLGAALA